MKLVRIGIVGAGPSGLVAAIAARKFGLEVTVFERAEQLRRIGGGIAIQNNGLRVLAAIGLFDELRPLLHEVRTVRVAGVGGRRLIGFEFSRARVPYPWMANLLRSDLQERMAAAAERSGTQLVLGQPAVGVSVGSGGAAVRLAGGEEHEFDVVIGADGIRSTVRESLGFRSRTRSANRAYLRGVSPAPTTEGLILEIWGPDGRRFGLAPLAAGLTYFFCSVDAGGWKPLLESGHIDRWIASWERYGPTVMTVLDAVEDWSAVNYDEVREVRLRSWTRPPVFLVGDAAHAMTPDLGQGANCAMVDALILARLLHRAVECEESVEVVGARYERLRRPFVRRVQAASRLASAMSGASRPLGRFARDVALRLQDKLAPLKHQALMLAAGHNRKETDLLEADPEWSRQPPDTPGKEN